MNLLEWIIRPNDLVYRLTLLSQITQPEFSLKEHLAKIDKY